MSFLDPMKALSWLSLPDKAQVPFMIIGAQKGGTTWLASTLNQLTEVTRSTPKETRFFNARWKAKYEKISVPELKKKYVPHLNIWSILYLYTAIIGTFIAFVLNFRKNGDRIANLLMSIFSDDICVPVKEDNIIKAFAAYPMMKLWKEHGSTVKIYGIYLYIRTILDSTQVHHTN